MSRAGDVSLAPAPYRVVVCGRGDGPVEAAAVVLSTAGLVVERVRRAAELAELLRGGPTAFDAVWMADPEHGLDVHALALVAAATALEIDVYACAGAAELGDFEIVWVDDVGAAAAAIATPLPRPPSSALERLQRYYARMASERDYRVTTAPDTMLLLIEEVGELARAIRESVGLHRAGAFPPQAVADELADVQLYLLHLANVLGESLSVAVEEKERRNHERSLATRELAS